MISPFLLALAASAALTPVLAQVFRRSGWVSSTPNRSGEHPALSGGLTVGLIVAALAALLGRESSFYELAGFWLGFLAIMISGLIDDWFDLAPLQKLLCQMASASITLGFLVVESRLRPDPVTCGILLAWVVAIVNAVNLLDNMDGLAGGVGVIASLSVGFVILSPGEAGRLIAVLLAGALLGFLAHNVSPARVFLGDTGSHIVGFTLAVLPLYSLNVAPPDWRGAAAVFLIFLVPIADTVFVTVRRTLEKRPFYSGGKDHTSHWLLSRGFSERAVAGTFYLLAISSSALAYLLVRTR